MYVALSVGTVKVKRTWGDIKLGDGGELPRHNGIVIDCHQHCVEHTKAQTVLIDLQKLVKTKHLGATC
eukprot:1574995-Amphidinium_carterae.1